MISFKSISSGVLAGALASVVGLGLPAQSAQAADFYKGKRIKMIIGSSPGGGYDTYARMISRHFGRFVPGAPRFLVQNKDGAGSIVTANFVVNVAPKDGTVIAGLQRNLALVQIMGTKGPRFKAKNLQWLGSLANEAGVCVVATRTGIKSFEEAFSKTILMAGFGPNDSEIQPALFQHRADIAINQLRLFNDILAGAAVGGRAGLSRQVKQSGIGADFPHMAEPPIG